MHEMSIAHAVVATVVSAVPVDGSRITSVHLLIGELAGVVPDALMFAYDVAAQGTALEGSELSIENAPAVVDCPRCGHVQLENIRDFRCPSCGDLCGKVVGGRELEIVDVVTVDSESGAAAETPDEETRVAAIAAGVLAKNDLLAASLRGRFQASGVRVSNWVSSPGSGKTALLEAMLALAVDREMSAATLVGDCATDNDAVRLARSGAQARQIITDGRCHLESAMVSEHLEGWDLDEFDLLVIENVGNLVCPASYDLGEDTRVALLSVTEGEDKPLKYPKLFHTADVVVVTKTDIADAVEWDRDTALANIRSVTPDATIVETSARTGAGVAALLGLLSAPVAPIADVEPSTL